MRKDLKKRLSKIFRRDSARKPWWRTPLERDNCVFGERPEFNSAALRDIYTHEGKVVYKNLGIETVNLCNFKCVFCPSRLIHRPPLVMAMGLFNKIIDEHKAYGGAGIGLNPVMGEVFLDPLLLKRIEYIDAAYQGQSHFIHILTNGLACEKWRDDELRSISDKIQGLTFSIYGLDAEEHDIITQTRNTYGRLVEQLRRAASMFTSSNRKISLHLRTIRGGGGVLNWVENIFGTDWRKLVNEPMQVATAYSNAAGLLNDGESLPLEGKWLPLEPPVPRLDFDYCPSPVNGHKVRVDGDLMFCPCWQNSGDNVLGNVNSVSLTGLYNSRQARRLWKSGPEQCQKCSNYLYHGYLRDYLNKTFALD
jgi:MoaA/NifB/PqqE/SkfB family radical SAM enzyme